VRITLAAVVAAALALPAAALAGRVTLQDTVPRAGVSTITITVRKPAAFRVQLRTSTQGRTRLFLLGRTAPGGGALLDTATTACEGAAGSFYCSGAYEPLPRGTYTFRIVRVSGPATPVTLTVRW
jgi:hypothetical protein